MLPSVIHLASPLQFKPIERRRRRFKNTGKINEILNTQMSVRDHIQTIIGRRRPVPSSIFSTIAECGA